MKTDQGASQDLSRLFVQRLCTAGLARPFWVNARVSWVPEWLWVHRTTLPLRTVGQLEEALPVADTLFRGLCSSYKNLLSLTFGWKLPWMHGGLFGCVFVFNSANSSLHKQDAWEKLGLLWWSLSPVQKAVGDGWLCSN